MDESKSEVRPSLDQPWVASTSTPEEALATANRAVGNQEIADIPSYADLNQPPVDETQPVQVVKDTSGTSEIPIDQQLHLDTGAAPDQMILDHHGPVEPTTPAPAEGQPESETRTEKLIAKMEKTRSDLDEEIQELIELQDASHGQQ